jgi:hypothetical protein
MPGITDSAVRIDRFVLEVPGTPADYGREVATLVAAGLAAAAELPRMGEVPTLRLALAANPRESATDLARRIVAETLRALARGT